MIKSNHLLYGPYYLKLKLCYFYQILDVKMYVN